MQGQRALPGCRESERVNGSWDIDGVNTLSVAGTCILPARTAVELTGSDTFHAQAGKLPAGPASNRQSSVSALHYMRKKRIQRGGEGRPRQVRQRPAIHATMQHLLLLYRQLFALMHAKAASRRRRRLSLCQAVVLPTFLRAWL